MVIKYNAVFYYPTSIINVILSVLTCRNPDVYTIQTAEDASENEDVERDFLGEMLDIYKRTNTEIQSVEKHDVR